MLVLVYQNSKQSYNRKQHSKPMNLSTEFVHSILQSEILKPYANGELKIKFVFAISSLKSKVNSILEVFS